MAAITQLTRSKSRMQCTMDVGHTLTDRDRDDMNVTIAEMAEVHTIQGGQLYSGKNECPNPKTIPMINVASVRIRIKSHSRTS